MPRFAILTHDWPTPHWDLLLETSATLRAWRLAQPPGTALRIAAEPLPDHRKLYLDYQGPVGGNRGWVTRWDGGEYMLLAEEAIGLRIHLSGHRWHGSAWIRRWEFISEIL